LQLRGLTGLVVSVRDLDCFDLLIWLRTGAHAASRLSASQSRVSRSIQKVSSLLGVSISKSDGEWDVHGDQFLLNLERRVHQEYRWRMGRPLRIEAQYYSGPLFCNPPPDGWMAGNFDYLEIHTPLEYLRNGVIDAWIGCFPDVPEDDDPVLTCFHLTRLPTHLVVGENHPLLHLGDAVTLEDVKHYPSLALPDGAYPKVQKVLQELGLWNLPQHIQRHSQLQNKTRYSSDLVVACASAFSISLFPTLKVILPIPIPLEVGDSLVVRRDYASHPRLLGLLDHLQSKAMVLSEEFSEVSIPHP
jgi:DNA-binding transcriptional LysR family regulator